MKLKTNLPRNAIQDIEFVSEGFNGEAGWFIYLNQGWSFDPMSNDGSGFISADNQHDAQTLCVYKVEA